MDSGVGKTGKGRWAMVEGKRKAGKSRCSWKVGKGRTKRLAGKG